MSTDKWNQTGSLGTFGRKAFAITPSDSTDLDIIPKGLVVAAAGTLSVIPEGNDDEDVVTFTEDLPVGYIVPFIVRRIRSTGTSATVYGIDG